MMTGDEREQNTIKNEEEKAKTAEPVEWSREAEKLKWEGGEGFDNEYDSKNGWKKSRFNNFMIFVGS
jgi:hypothetical protein